MVKGHRKRFPKLVKMLGVIYYNQFQLEIFFHRNKVVMVSKAPHMAETLIKNLRNVTSSLPNPKTLHVVLFNPYYVFHIVFIKHTK